MAEKTQRTPISHVRNVVKDSAGVIIARTNTIANAEYIMTAWNNYDRLVETLTLLTDEFDFLADLYGLTQKRPVSKAAKELLKELGALK